MSTYRVFSSSKSVESFVTHYAERFGICRKVAAEGYETKGDTHLRVSPIKTKEGKILCMDWRMRNGDGSVDVDFSPTTNKEASIGIWVGFVLGIVFLFLAANNLLSSFRPGRSLDDTIFQLVVAALLLYAVATTHKRFRLLLTRMDEEFFSSLSRDLPANVVIRDINVLSDDFPWMRRSLPLLYVLLYMPILLALSKFLPGLLILVIAIYSAKVILAGILKERGGATPVAQWQANLMSVIQSWQNLSMNLLNLTVFLYFANVVLIGHHEFGSGTPPNGNAGVFIEPVVAFVVVAIFVVMLILHWGHLKRLLSTAMYWDVSADGGGESHITPSRVSALESRRPRILDAAKVALYALLALTSLVGMLLAVEGTWYALFQRPCIVQSIGEAYSQLFASLSTLSHSGVLRAGLSLGLLAICFPSLAMLVLGLRTWVKLATAPRNGTVEQTQAPTFVTVLVESLCNRKKLPHINVYVQASSGTSIETVVGFPWTKEASIQVTEGALNTLSEKEITAAVAHEVGHVALHLDTLRWIKFASKCFPFLGNSFMLLVDFVRMEHEADLYAVSEAVVNRNDLTNAILKLAVRSTYDRLGTEDRVTKQVGTSMDHIRSLYRAIFVNEFVGYSHPFVQDRLSLLENAL